MNSWVRAISIQCDIMPKPGPHTCSNTDLEPDPQWKLLDSDRATRQYPQIQNAEKKEKGKEIYLKPISAIEGVAYAGHAPSMKMTLVVFFLLNPQWLLIYSFLAPKHPKNTNVAVQVSHTPPRKWCVVRVDDVSRLVGDWSIRWHSIIVRLNARRSCGLCFRWRWSCAIINYVV